MLKIDKAIFDTDQVICDNIDSFDITNRGLLSQNILSQLRNFVEYIAMKAYAGKGDINPNDYDLRKKALQDLQSRGNLRFLSKFHNMLQKSVSHYTIDKDGSERLMLKYYEYLLRIKVYLKNEYNIDVLNNIDDYPLNTDTEISDYYLKISERIENPSPYSRSVVYNDRYYIEKIKPFFVNHKIYYEVTFTATMSKANKFNRVIAFTKQDIMKNYAVKFSIHSDNIFVFDKAMEILVIDDWQVSIRPCEFSNYSSIFGPAQKFSATNEYNNLMQFLRYSGMSLTELICCNQSYYDKIKAQLTINAQSTIIAKFLDKSRAIILNDDNGANVIRYLLHHMNNSIIKSQRNHEQCYVLSNLYLRFECIPFDQMPYCSSLYNHNPRIYDLFESISPDGREHEFLARFIRNNTEIEGKLFTASDELERFENIDVLIQEYNSRLYYKHTGRRIMKYKDFFYIDQYVVDSEEIIKELQQLSQSGVDQYTASVNSWLKRSSYIIDDEYKGTILQNMFASSHVAFIYGSAGTGKSTLIKHISNFWSSSNKFFLANTHPAVDNLRRKITVENSSFYTIKKFLSNKNLETDCDILIIDECSTVSNADMRKVLTKAKYQLLVLVGDVYQIESIYFGNWFSIAQKYMPKSSVFELKYPYRTENKELLTVWDRVRNLDDAILEPLVKNGYVARLDESIFERQQQDKEIILCLNYDGLYGINNINRFLQSSNPNKSVIWGINTYKVDDPILFNESNIFAPLIHNNSKGKIVDIHVEDTKITFEIELDITINELEASKYSFDLLGLSESGYSIISFSVNKYRNTDEDDDDDDSTVIPFQVAYAVSIHKAQGLEYDSVKIVISNEVEERITHNIFYTAITRAKNDLKIYWSPETEDSVLKRLKIKDTNKDAYLLASLKGLSIISH